MSEIRIYDRVSRDYHSEVITPFSDEVDFRLADDLRALLNRWRRDGSINARTIVDFGCGIGEAIELVAGRVGIAVGLDFSPGMLEATRRRLREIGVSPRTKRGLRDLGRAMERRSTERRGSVETILVRANMLRLGALRGRCDLALAINSVASSTASRSYRMFEQIAASLRPGGTFIGVFPSLDTFEHLLELHRRSGWDDGLDRRVDLRTGVYRESGAVDVKCWRPEELRRLTSRHGLRLVRLVRINYPWEMMRRYGWGYYPRARRLWDWYLVASRPLRAGHKK